MKTSNQQDPLKRLFTQLPKERLSETFRSDMMQQIMAEAIRIKKRNERLAMVAVIAASVIMLALGVLAVIYLGLPKLVIDWPKIPSLTSAPLALYVGALSLLLLFADYQLRKTYKRKHKD